MQNGALVAVGDNVKQGQHIAYSGNTGFSTTAHLHFGVAFATFGERRKTLPTLFKTQKGVVKNLMYGESYSAVGD